MKTMYAKGYWILARTLLMLGSISSPALAEPQKSLPKWSCEVTVADIYERANGHALVATTFEPRYNDTWTPTSTKVSFQIPDLTATDDLPFTIIIEGMVYRDKPGHEILKVTISQECHSDWQCSFPLSSASVDSAGSSLVFSADHLIGKNGGHPRTVQVACENKAQ